MPIYIHLSSVHVLVSVQVMKGYIGDDTQSLQIFDKNGWLKTGE